MTRRATSRVTGSVDANPGYFTIKLSNGVRAEMTASKHTALYRFSLPEESEIQAAGLRIANSPLVLVDLIDLANSRSTGNITVDPHTGRIMGNGTYVPSFGRGTYKAYFCADFTGSNVRTTGTFIDELPDDKEKGIANAKSGFFSPSGSIGAFVQFYQPENNTILARVGVSFVSSEQACRSAEQEIADYDFDRVVNSARAAWREKMNVIQTDAAGVTDELQTVFWSGIYRSMLSPLDYSGENPFWDSEEPYFDS